MADEKISDLPAAITVADADIAPVVQGGTNKKSALSVIKTYLTTAFDAIYVPLTRTLTIGGSAQSLASNRSWTTTDILDGLGTEEQGNILYRGASNWILMPPSTDGNVLTTHSTGANPTWTAPTAGAPTNVDYLVGTASGSLSAEIVVGTTPGGELGGTWASPTIDDGVSVSNWVLTTPTITTGIEPTSNDGAALGTTTKQFSDLFLAEGGVINFDNGDATITQVGDVVSLAGADLKITTAGTASTSVATTDATQTLSNKRNTPRITTITSSATPTVNTDNCDAVTITALAAAITSMTTNLTGTPNNFDKLIFRILDDGNARAITWGAKFVAKGVALPTTTVVSKLLTVGFIYDTVAGSGTWGCVASAQET